MAPRTRRQDVPRVISDFPAQIDGLAEIFRRRRIAVGLDRFGQVVLARPHSIQVDYRGDTKRKRAALELVKPIDADNADVMTRYDPESTGVLTVHVPAEVAEINRESRYSVAGLNDQLAHFRGNGFRADLRHVFVGAQSLIPSILSGSASQTPISAPRETSASPDGKVTLLTSAEPAGPPPHLREPLDLRGGRRPQILVLDSGLSTQSRSGRSGHGRLPQHADLRTSRNGKRLHVHIHGSWQSSPDIDWVDDEDEPDDDASGTLDFEAGHGTFITGIIRQICPDAEIHPAGVLSSFGEGDTSRLLDTVKRMAAECGQFDIVVLCFGAFFSDDDAGLFGENLRSLLGDALLIGAAGNGQTCRPYFPAALPGVIGVGGLGASGKAWFTNFGPWVDASAPAVDVVSTFFNEFAEVVDGVRRRHYREWARWSGTSFAAPKVAGVIAHEMYVNRISAKEAWARLSSPKHLRMPDLGVVFNV